MLHSKPFDAAPEAWKPNCAARANVDAGGSWTISVSGIGAAGGVVVAWVEPGVATGDWGSSP